MADEKREKPGLEAKDQKDPRWTGKVEK